MDVLFIVSTQHNGDVTETQKEETQNLFKASWKVLAVFLTVTVQEPSEFNPDSFDNSF